ncbi:MAG: MOSC domain-containing protein, partial [Kangiellaceae bacterium]|nr:MOSC domain-containing protein [Kangiellaceae bacterium]
MHLSEMYIYRVKSLAGSSISQSEVSPLGLKNDRMMMLVDESGVFISQRKYPQLASLKLENQANNELIFFNGKDNSLVMNTDTDFGASTIDVEVWKDKCSGYVAKDSV